MLAIVIIGAMIGAMVDSGKYRDRVTGRFAKAPIKPVYEYRIVCEAGERITRSTPWRATRQEAERDARAEGLASYDEERREWYLAVPVRLDSRKI